METAGHPPSSHGNLTSNASLGKMQYSSSQLFGGALEPLYSIRFSQIGYRQERSVQLGTTNM